MADIGAERLINSILDDARAAAAATEADAATAIAQINTRLEQDKSDIRTASARRAEAVHASILDRERINAELDGRKLLLQKRRRLMDRAFDEAYASLCSLSGDERYALIRRTLIAEAEGGERVRPAGCDTTLVKRAVAEINPMLAEQGKAPLTVGGTADIEAGFVLVSDRFVKDCSFASLLAAVREDCEPDVVSVLFD